MTMQIKPQHEVFCRAYVGSGNATEAARKADYSWETAANQAYRLLKRPEIQARVAELTAERAADDAAYEATRAAHRDRLAAMRATEAEALLAKLDPIYEEMLDTGDHSGVLKVVALQARIAGLLGEDDHRPRSARAKRGAGAVSGSSEDGLGLAGRSSDLVSK